MEELGEATGEINTQVRKKRSSKERVAHRLASTSNVESQGEFSDPAFQHGRKMSGMSRHTKSSLAHKQP